MKKVIAVLLLVVATCSALFACNKSGTTTEDNRLVLTPYVALTPDESYAGQTLIEFMDDQKQQGKLSYTAEDGTYGAYVTSINGISITSDKYWLVYTDDEENANSACGEILYGDKVYAFAVSGVSSLVITAGCSYIWVLK